MAEKTKVFINYRQIDCTALANSLGEVFRRRLGEDAFFLDKYAINYGNSCSPKTRNCTCNH